MRERMVPNGMKAVLIEDDKELSETLRLSLKIRWPEGVIFVAREGKQGLDCVRKENPDVVVLDIGLPDISGYEVLKQIRAFSSVPVIILTVRNEESDIIRGLELGADDYQVKPFRPLELLSRIQVQLRRVGSSSSEKPLTCGTLHFRPVMRILYSDGREISLTRTESIILAELMNRPGATVTYSRLADAVWGNEYPESTESLRVYIMRLRDKIEENPKDPRIIHTKQGVGYYLTA